MIVVDSKVQKILLIQQYGKPFYILVAGYVNRGESLEDAVIRELNEETGLSAQNIRYNRSKFFEPSNTLMCNFTVFVKNARDLSVNDEIDAYDWFSFDEARKKIRKDSLAEEFLRAYLDED